MEDTGLCVMIGLQFSYMSSAQISLSKTRLYERDRLTASCRFSHVYKIFVRPVDRSRLLNGPLAIAVGAALDAPLRTLLDPRSGQNHAHAGAGDRRVNTVLARAPGIM